MLSLTIAAKYLRISDMEQINTYPVLTIGYTQAMSSLYKVHHTLQETFIISSQYKT